MIALPASFIVMALATALWRQGVDVDRQRRIYTSWWGVGFPWRRKIRGLDDAYGHVSLGVEVRGSGKSRRTVYPVSLAGEGVLTLELIAPQDYGKARRGAEQLANHLGLGMHDVSSGTLVVRAAGTLDEPLRDRLLRERVELPALGEPPERLVVSYQGKETACKLPPPGLTAKRGMAMASCVMLMGFLLFTGVMWGGDQLQGATLIPLALAAVPLLILIVMLLRALVARDKVVLSHDGVKLKPWGLRRSRQISAEALEELIMVPAVQELGFFDAGGKLVARSDEESLELATGLKERELHWLHDAARHALIATAFGYRSSPRA